MFKRKKQNKIDKTIAQFEEMTNKLIYILEKINLTDYIEYLSSTNQILWKSFLIGLAKGFGGAIGFSVLGAIVIYIFIETNIINIPAMQDYLKNLLSVLK